MRLFLCGPMTARLFLCLFDLRLLLCVSVTDSESYCVSVTVRQFLCQFDC